jgi:hypothetical protein
MGLTMHLSYAQIPRRQKDLKSLEEVFRFVAPDLREAVFQTAAQLDHLGIRHALAGGLAVGAHGYIRATVDVDFLVGEEAFEHHVQLVTFKSGVPIEVLIYMKLAAGRRKDMVDVIELIKAGADVKAMQNYLTQYAGDLLPLFAELVNEALAE